MTLAQLLSSPLPPLHELRGLWLVFDDALKNALLSVQDENATVQAIPLELSNGQYALCADLLTETQGAYASAFSHLNPSNFSLVDVIDNTQFLTLQPTAEP